MSLQDQIAIDSASKLCDTAQVKANLARTLLAALTNDCKAYCVLSGYDHLPDSFDTDIDFMVDSGDFDRMPQIIEGVAKKSNSKLFHTVGHELSARSYSLGFQAGERLIIVQPDATADYRHFGLLWLRADEVLAGRRQHANGLWIPAPPHEFAYYLIKRLNKRTFDAQHGLKLHRLYLKDPAGCDKMIARFWKGSSRTLLIRMASTNDTVAYIPAPGPAGIVLTQSPTPAAEGIDGPRISLLVSESETAPRTIADADQPSIRSAHRPHCRRPIADHPPPPPPTNSPTEAYVMPNLVGLSLFAASARVTAIGLHITSIEALPSTIASVPSPTAPGAAGAIRPLAPMAPVTPSNTVVSQIPVAGRRVTKGTPIHIALSH